MNLYQYGEEFEAQIESVQLLLDEGKEPDSEEVQSALQAMINAEGDYEQKVLRVGRFIRECQANADAAKIEKDRLARIESNSRKKAESLQGLLLDQMIAFGKDSISDGLLTVATRLNPWSVDVTDPDKLPEEYKRVKIEADKVKLKKDREILGEIAGVTFSRNYSLRIT